MKTIKLAPGERLVTNQLNRKGVLPQNIIDAARDIVANVRANGDAAVRDYCQRFDGVELQGLRNRSMPRSKASIPLLSWRSKRLHARFVSSTSARSSRAGLPHARTARCSALR